jgi:flagellar hook-associated protein 3 FlgL
LRITSNMMGRNLLQNLEAAQGKMTDLQNMMSSGHRISKPSDDPAGIENALSIKGSLTMVKQWKSNADDAISYMSMTDSTLGDVSSMLQRARELAVQGASDSSSPQARGALAQEVDQIAAQIRMLANTKMGSKYIFSGTKTDTQPVPPPSSGFLGSINPVQFDLGNNTQMPVSVDGQGIFVNPLGVKLLSDGPVTPWAPLTTNYGILDTLSHELQFGTSSTISATLNGIDANIDNILGNRAVLGARINRVTAISSQLDTTSINLTANLSSIQDTDISKTIIDFQTQQNIYTAALSIGAKIIQPSLVDYMR